MCAFELQCAGMVLSVELEDHFVFKEAQQRLAVEFEVRFSEQLSRFESEVFANLGI